MLATHGDVLNMDIDGSRRLAFDLAVANLDDPEALTALGRLADIGYSLYHQSHGLFAAFSRVAGQTLIARRGLSWRG